MKTLNLIVGIIFAYIGTILFVTLNQQILEGDSLSPTLWQELIFFPLLLFVMAGIVLNDGREK